MRRYEPPHGQQYALSRRLTACASLLRGPLAGLHPEGFVPRLVRRHLTVHRGQWVHLVRAAEPRSSQVLRAPTRATQLDNRGAASVRGRWGSARAHWRGKPPGVHRRPDVGLQHGLRSHRLADQPSQRHDRRGQRVHLRGDLANADCVLTRCSTLGTVPGPGRPKADSPAAPVSAGRDRGTDPFQHGILCAKR